MSMRAKIFIQSHLNMDWFGKAEERLKATCRVIKSDDERIFFVESDCENLESLLQETLKCFPVQIQIFDSKLEKNIIGADRLHTFCQAVKLPNGRYVVIDLDENGELNISAGTEDDGNIYIDAYLINISIDGIRVNHNIGDAAFNLVSTESR